MMLSVQLRAFGDRICLGVLVQVVVMVLLPLLKFNIHMSGLGNVKEMQQLLVFLKKMRMINKMNTLTSYYYQYPADRVPPHTSFKLRQEAGCISTRCHVPYSSGPCLPAKVGSGTAM
jgi:hypothetical protein